MNFTSQFAVPKTLQASSILTSSNVQVSNNDTVTINGRAYTFKTTLTPTANEVHIGADADGSLTNLAAAINGTGTSGTDYAAATTVNTDVSAGAVTAHAITVTARRYGTAGNAITTTKSAATLSWTSTVMAGGLAMTAVPINTWCTQLTVANLLSGSGVDFVIQAPTVASAPEYIVNGGSYTFTANAPGVSATNRCFMPGQIIGYIGAITSPGTFTGDEAS